jgi:hypothetical protein
MNLPEWSPFQHYLCWIGLTVTKTKAYLQIRKLRPKSDRTLAPSADVKKALSM